MEILTTIFILLGIMTVFITTGSSIALLKFVTSPWAIVLLVIFVLLLLKKNK